MFPDKLESLNVSIIHESDVFAKRPGKTVHAYSHNEATTGMHSHDFYELIIILGNNGCHYIGDMKIPTTAGDVFVIPPGVEHGYYFPEKLEVFYILLHSSFMEKYYETLLSVPGFSALFEIEPYLRQVYEKHLFLHLESRKLELFKEKIIDILKYDTPEYYEYQTFSVLHFISELSLLMQKNTEKGKNSSKEDSDIFKVLAYIQENFNQKITVAELMKVANMSRPTLHRRFKSVTQTTPMEYILNLRLNAVKNRLSQTGDANKTELAQEYGFYDSSHLNKHLKDKKRS
jgi:AraC-like DNA-binding protein